MSAPGHMIPDHETILQRGFNGVREDCENALKMLRPLAQKGA